MCVPSRRESYDLVDNVRVFRLERGSRVEDGPLLSPPLDLVGGGNGRLCRRNCEPQARLDGKSGGQLTNPLLFASAVQLLAYYVAVYKGTDVDQPRNLAKSVTVE